MATGVQSAAALSAATFCYLGGRISAPVLARVKPVAAVAVCPVGNDWLAPGTPLCRERPVF